jgi:hypothetical protein
MQSLPRIKTISTYSTHVTELFGRVTQLLDNPEERRTFFCSDHSLHVHHLGVHDLQVKIQHLGTAFGRIYGEISPSSLPTSFLHPFSTSTASITAPPPPNSIAGTSQQPPTATTTTLSSSNPSSTPTAHSTITAASSTYPSSSACRKPLDERLDEYEISYLGSLKRTLEKFDAKFVSGGEYAKNDTLQFFHIPTSTRSVERVFSTVDWLFKTRGAKLRAVLLAALIARHEAKESELYLNKYLKQHQVPSLLLLHLL